MEMWYKTDNIAMVATVPLPAFQIHSATIVPGVFALAVLSAPPATQCQAGLKVLAVVRENRSSGSTKSILTTSGAMATQNPLLQQVRRSP